MGCSFYGKMSWLDFRLFAVAFLSGVPFKTPISYLVFELAVVILPSTAIGILINWRFPIIENHQQILTGITSLCYIGLLLIVVSSNAQGLLALRAFAFGLLAIEIVLNLFGYLSAFITAIILKNKGVFCPTLFILGSKEFGIATAATSAIGLNASVTIPSAFYAIVQMISMPIAVKIIGRFKEKTV